jgi:aldehyde dehydrogenase (NAD+)
MTQKNSLDINTALKSLGIKDLNSGTSTGLNSFGNGESISSYSPVDGKIGEKNLHP